MLAYFLINNCFYAKKLKPYISFSYVHFMFKSLITSFYSKATVCYCFHNCTGIQMFSQTTLNDTQTQINVFQTLLTHKTNSLDNLIMSFKSHDITVLYLKKDLEININIIRQTSIILFECINPYPFRDIQDHVARQEGPVYNWSSRFESVLHTVLTNRSSRGLFTNLKSLHPASWIYFFIFLTNPLLGYYGSSDDNRLQYNCFY